MKSSYKGRDIERCCALCGKKLESQYDWHAIEITRHTPYERKVAQKIFTLSQFDENNEYNDTKFDHTSGIIKRAAIFPDWHRNRKAIIYCCKDHINELEKTILNVLPKEVGDE